jgi:hypothetical protein
VSVGCLLLICGCWLALGSHCWGATGWRRYNYRAIVLWGLRILSAILIGGGLGAFLLPVYYDCRYNYDCHYQHRSSHNRESVALHPCNGSRS